MNEPAHIDECLEGKLVRKVAAHFGVPEGDLLGRKRTRRLATARQAYFYMRHQRGSIMTEVARETGYDISTINHGVSRTKARLESGEITLPPYPEVCTGPDKMRQQIVEMAVDRAWRQMRPELVRLLMGVLK